VLKIISNVGRQCTFVHRHLGVHGACNFLLPDLGPSAIRDLRDPDAIEDDDDI